MFVIPIAKKMVIGAVAVGALSLGTAGLAGAATVPATKAISHFNCANATKVLDPHRQGRGPDRGWTPQAHRGPGQGEQGRSHQAGRSSGQADHTVGELDVPHSPDQGHCSHRGQVQRDRSEHGIDPERIRHDVTWPPTRTGRWPARVGGVPAPGSGPRGRRTMRRGRCVPDHPAH